MTHDQYYSGLTESQRIACDTRVIPKSRLNRLLMEGKMKMELGEEKNVELDK